MEATGSKGPEYKKVLYRFNEVTKYYDRIDSPPGFEKLPPELKVEETRRPDIIHSKIVVHGRIRAGKYLFFTGIIPVNGSNWFFGDHFEQVNGNKKNSFILFHFAPGNVSFTVYYWGGYKLFPRHRAKFISEFIRSIKQ